MDDIFRNFEPRAGGWSRLNAKMISATEQHRSEMRLWGAVASIMLITSVFVIRQNHLENQLPTPAFSAQAVVVESGQAVEVPGTPPGIRYYWVFNDRRLYKKNR